MVSPGPNASELGAQRGVMTVAAQILGVGLTNACDLRCAHCYRSVGHDELSSSQVLAAVDAAPTRAVNFGTGESGLHPEFASLVRLLRARGIDSTVTTNGYSAAVLDDDTLSMLRDVEFSVDFPTEEAHDTARGPGNWTLIEKQMARCRELGVRTTIITVMMSNNYRALPALARLAFDRGALLRVNVYQAVRSDLFSLSYDQFWEGFRGLFAVADLVTCGEPILRAVLGMPKAEGSGCGAQTVRLTPRGAVVPCVYGGDSALGLDDLVRLGRAIGDEPAFQSLRVVPNACTACPQVETCGGGCPSRRAMRGTLDEPDVYCPFVRGDNVTFEGVRERMRTEAMPAKGASACTTIVKWRS